MGKDIAEHYLVPALKKFLQSVQKTEYVSNRLKYTDRFSEKYDECTTANFNTAPVKRRDARCINTSDRCSSRWHRGKCSSTQAAGCCSPGC